MPTPPFDFSTARLCCKRTTPLLVPVSKIIRARHHPFLTAICPALSQVVHAFPQQLATPPNFPFKPLLVPFLLLLVPVSSGRLRARLLRSRRPSLPKHAPAHSGLDQPTHPSQRDRGKSTLNSDATCLKLVDTLRMPSTIIACMRSPPAKSPVEIMQELSVFDFLVYGHRRNRPPSREMPWTD